MNFINQVFKTQLGRLRLLSYLEGISLLFLFSVAMPLKYYADLPFWVRMVGPIHGLLFLWFVITTLSVGVERGWKFKDTTWKVLIGCIVPFGTFYIDTYILKPIADADVKRLDDDASEN